MPGLFHQQTYSNVASIAGCLNRQLDQGSEHPGKQLFVFGMPLLVLFMLLLKAINFVLHFPECRLEASLVLLSLIKKLSATG